MSNTRAALSVMSGMEVLPVRAEIFIPENKRSAWVSMKGTNGKIIPSRSSKEECQGSWVIDGYTFDNTNKKSSSAVEVWIFQDDDELGIDRRVLENNPLQGSWGYAPGTDPRRATPEQTWFFPPKSAKAKIPNEFKNYKHMGTWVKPTFKRDFSQLGSHKAGFLNVSGERRIVKGEKHSVTGKWNMLGYNDDIVRGKSKNPTKLHDDDHSFNKSPSSTPSRSKSYRSPKPRRKPGVAGDDDVPSTPSTQPASPSPSLSPSPRVPKTPSRSPKPRSMSMPSPFKSLRSPRTRAQKPKPGVVDPSHKKSPPSTPKPSMSSQSQSQSPSKSKSPSVPKTTPKPDVDHGIRTLPSTPSSTKSPSKSPRSPNDGKPKVKVITPMRKKSSPRTPRLRSNNPVVPKKTDDVKVETPSGDILPVPFDPAKDNVNDIKKKVSNLVGTPVKDITLTDPEGLVVNDDHVPTPGAVLTMAPSVEVEVPDYSKVKLIVLPKMTVEDVKDDLQELIGDKPPRVFRYDAVDDELPDDGVLSKMKLPTDGTALKLTLDPDTIEIKHPDGRSFIFDFEHEPSIDELRKQAAALSGFPLKNIKLSHEDDILDPDYTPRKCDVLCMAPIVNVELPDRSKLELAVLPTMKVADVKEEVYNETGGAPVHSRLFFLDGEEEDIPDEVTLPKMGIPLHGKTLKIEPTEMDLQVRDSLGRTFVVTILPDEPVRSAKKRIREKIGIDIRSFNGDQSWDDVDDDIPIKDSCLVRNGGIITVELVQTPSPSRGKISLSISPVKLAKHVWEEDDDVSLDVASNGQRQGVFCPESSSKSPSLPKSGKVGIALTQNVKAFADIEDAEAVHMKVHVRVPNKKNLLKFRVDQNDLVGKLRKRIENKVEVSGDPCLMLGGHQLKDTNTLQESNVQHDDLLILETFTLNVMHFEGNNFTLSNLKFSDTILSVKRRIQAMFDVEPLDLIQLVYNGRRLHDENTLSKERIPHRAPLVMEPPDGVATDLLSPKKRLKGRKVKKLREHEDEIIIPVQPDYKNRLFIFDSEYDFDAHIEIIVMDARTGKSHVLGGLLLSDRVDKIRFRIFDVLGVPKKKQVLKFCGQILKNKKTLLFQKMHHKAVVTMEIPMKNTISTPDLERIEFGRSQALLPSMLSQYVNLTIHVWNGDVYELKDVPVMEYADDLRDRILAISSIPIDHQRLTYRGKPLDDTLNLSEQNIPNGSKLKLEGMHVFVKFQSTHESLRVNVNFDDTIGKLKRKVSKEMAEQKDVLCIMLGGEECQDDQQTLAELGIENEDILVGEHFMLSCVHWLGGVFELRSVSPNDTIYIVKEEIEKHFSISTYEQRLSLNGQMLMDMLSLRAQGVSHRSVIMLEDDTRGSVSPIKKKASLSLSNGLPSLALDEVNQAIVSPPSTKASLAVSSKLSSNHFEEGFESVTLSASPKKKTSIKKPKRKKSSTFK